MVGLTEIGMTFLRTFSMFSLPLSYEKEAMGLKSFLNDEFPGKGLNRKTEKRYN